MRPFLPRSEFELSELSDVLDVEQPLTDRRQVHTTLAIALLTIDHLGPKGERHDLLKGLVQAWDYVARQHDEDVSVEYTGQPWQNLSTTVTTRETTDDDKQDAQYAILNTRSGMFLNLEGTGPMLTTRRKAAAAHARMADHLALVRVESLPLTEPTQTP